MQSVPVCSTELTLVDLDTDSTIILGDDNVTMLENSLTFTATLLTVNRQYDLTAVLSNAAGFAVSHTMLSKHCIATRQAVMTVVS